MIIYYRKRINYNTKLWYVNVSLYESKRVCLTLSNKKEIKEITIDIKDAYLDKGHIFLDPAVNDNGILKVLKKYRIIKQIDGTICYNYTLVPIALLNTGILRSYDYVGVSKYKEFMNKEA